MNYEIFGDKLPAVTIDLEPGESIYTQSGGMSWMSDSMKMDTNMKGGLMQGLSRWLSNESIFMATYTATKPGDSITIASTFPGTIIPLDLSGGKEYVCQKDSFLCAQPEVVLDIEVLKGWKSGLFGGEGFVLQRMKGEGIVWIEIDGSVKEIELERGQKLKVDTGNVAAYEPTCSYSVETVKGFKNILFGGEGLFLTTLEGPGKVWLQTITMPSFAGRLIPYLPAKKD